TSSGLIYPQITPYPTSSTLFPSTTLFRSVWPLASVQVKMSPPLLFRMSRQQRANLQSSSISFRPPLAAGSRLAPALSSSARRRRSEEHTSELQSRFDLVCRLLLEKKKCPH